MSFGIILATHAHIGEALLEGAEMLAGKQDRVKALSLTEDTSVEQFEALFNASYDTLRQSCDFIVVLCDIYGGSPFNVTSRTLLSGKELIAFTGVNLPILIDLLFSGDLTPDEVRAHVAETASTSIQEVKVQFAEESEEDDLDL
ncbi:PTS sugar transporter subunit IIA [Collinsella intestinalis]|uniref:PTS sugar transporter subunit IIA n=1 Tax=Collinsella intestinalis TaxID=147207 RepID=UPI00195C296B|nr:hypothetical protein [Collinsella intestinalis]MBM6907041.1 hypothetical protein [Collinsella intestinalis]